MKDLILNLLKSKPSQREAQVLVRKLGKRNIGLLCLQEFHPVKLLLEPWIFTTSMKDTLEFMPFHRGILEFDNGSYRFTNQFKQLVVNGGHKPVFNGVILDIQKQQYYTETAEVVLPLISQLLVKENVTMDRFIITSDALELRNELINLQEWKGRSRELDIIEKVLKENQNTLGMIIKEKDLDKLNSTLMSEKNTGFPIDLVRHGFLLKEFKDLEQVDLRKLVKLLEKSFRKSLKKDYLKRLKRHLDRIIVTGDYLGAAIVTREDQLMYLDKFSVDPATQGMGVADILWKRLRTEYPDLFWRSRVENPVNKWYFDRSDGNFKVDAKWMLFFYGENKLECIDKYRLLARDLPVSFDSNEQNKD